MDPEIVFALYRSHEGQDEKLERLIANHLPTVRQQGLIADREPILGRAKDGTYIEIFEWKSAQAIRDAPENVAVRQIWASMENVCDFVTLDALEESKQVFPHFAPVVTG